MEKKDLLSPIDFLEKLSEKINDKVNLSNQNFWGEFFTTKTQTPAVNILQTEKGVSLEMAIPGCDKKDVEISLEKNVLTISCKKEDSKLTFSRREFSYHSFSRSFNLADSLDKNNIKSYMENGVLNVEIGKLKTEDINSQKKKIPVE